MFKKYRATKENVILLERAMIAVYGDAVKEKSGYNAVNNYQSYKANNWFNMFSINVNEKMQELEITKGA